MCHIFFIHSSVDEHLGCFHVLVIVNSAAVNIVVHVSFGIMVFSGYMPSSGKKKKWDNNKCWRGCGNCCILNIRNGYVLLPKTNIDY